MKIEFLDECVKHLHPDVRQALWDVIVKDAKLAEKVKKGRKKPIEDFIRDQLNLKELGAGASTGRVDFWTYRGWSQTEAEEKARKRYSDVDSRLHSPFSRTAKQYEGMTEEEITQAISSRRPSNVEYWKLKGFSDAEARAKVAEFQLAGSRAGIAALAGRTDYTPTQIGYWIAKGLSEMDAAAKVKSYQNTRGIGAHIRRKGDVAIGVQSYLDSLKTPSPHTELLTKSAQTWTKGDMEDFISHIEDVLTKAREQAKHKKETP